MAVGAHLNIDRWQRGAYLKGVAARARHLCLRVIGWMDILFHILVLSRGKKKINSCLSRMVVVCSLRMAIIIKPPVAKQDAVIEEMTRAGLQFGHKTSKTHPKMKSYIAGVRNTVHMFDLAKTKEGIQAALEYIKSLQAAGKTLLLVGTKVQIKNLVRETAAACSLPYVSERWIGGTFTNFGTIAKRIEYFRGLEQKKQAGELEKYTKKEQLDIAEELKNLELHFGGLKSLSKLPDAVFICDLDKNQLVLKEAKNKGVPVIALVDTNIDPSLVDYVIPANDDAQSSVRYILGKIQELYVSH